MSEPRQREWGERQTRMRALSVKLASATHADDGLLAEAVGLCEGVPAAACRGTDVALLRQAHRLRPTDTAIAARLAFALRREQDYVGADEVFSRIVDGGCDDATLLFAQAQTRFELGLPAADLFAAAALRAPTNLEIIRNQAAAMAVEGRRVEAEELLLATLADKPDWLDGHKTIATLRWTAGDSDRFLDTYRAAVDKQPRLSGLWLAWFGALCQAKRWDEARHVLDKADRQLGRTATLVGARFYHGVESGDLKSATRLYQRTAALSGDMINLSRVRFLLKTGQLNTAHNMTIPLLQTASATVFWPYAELIWRLLGDPRADWLDRSETLIQVHESGLSQTELSDLATTLERLHTADAPYLDQTVRGGTQTDRSVMLRAEPVIQKLKKTWIDVLRRHIADMSSQEPLHPVLAGPREHLLIEGSWSVRLQPNGYNVPHTHPRGWLSSVFYVSMPDTDTTSSQANIAFGVPPAELGLDLPARRMIAPRPGQIVVFPSMTWHATVPFERGERMVVALDISPPDY